MKWNETVIEAAENLPDIVDYFKVTDAEDEKFQQHRQFKSKIGKFLDAAHKNIDKLQKIINSYKSKENPYISSDIWQTVVSNADEQWSADGNNKYAYFDEISFKILYAKYIYYLSALEIYVKFKMQNYYSESEVENFRNYLSKNKINL